MRRARPTFELEVDDLKHITLICRLVGGSMEIQIARQAWRCRRRIVLVVVYISTLSEVWRWRYEDKGNSYQQ
jgi:hypothetical protein